MAKSKLVEVNKKIEEGVVGGYKKIENGVVGGFQKISDKFVDNYLTKDGESIEEAKERIAREQSERAKEQEVNYIPVRFIIAILARLKKICKEQ